VDITNSNDARGHDAAERRTGEGNFDCG
jgi:hypothetical protein